MTDNLVSIIMPSYNTGRYIAESIRSVLAQTYTLWELIIVDDCSTDDTEEVVKTFNDSRIRFLKNEKNCGAALTRNRAIREANGEWIAFLDSDDLWAPDKLEKQLAFMKENGYVFSYHDYIKIDEGSSPIGIYVSGPDKVTRHKMYNYGYPGCLTFIYSAKALGLVQIKDSEAGKGAWVNTSNPRMRESYARWQDDFFRKEQALLHRYDISNVDVSTDGDYVKSLMGLFR